MPDQATDQEIMAAMHQYGGGFVRSLAIAAAFADEINLEKIKATWPELWMAYNLFAINERPESDN